MIVKIQFKEDLIMLFGNSYKDFDEQLEEYVRLHKKTLPYPEIVYESQSKWKGWGGLKWCAEENFQQELNREGCQSSEPDNSNPRKYSEMKFYTPSTKTIKKIIKIVDKYLRSD
jgi:hypothetical protein